MPEHSFPSDKDELLSVIEREWNSLMDVMSRLDEIQMTTPGAGGWSPKDNLAHLTEWMKILLGYHMDLRPDYEVIGVEPAVTKDWDFDAINRVLFARNRGRTIDDVLSEAKRVYSQVCDQLKATSFEDLMKPRFPEEPESPPVLAYVIGNTSGHFIEHRTTIEKAFGA